MCAPFILCSLFSVALALLTSPCADGSLMKLKPLIALTRSGNEKVRSKAACALQAFSSSPTLYPSLKIQKEAALALRNISQPFTVSSSFSSAPMQVQSLLVHTSARPHFQCLDTSFRQTAISAEVLQLWKKAESVFNKLNSQIRTSGPAGNGRVALRPAGFMSHSTQTTFLTLFLFYFCRSFRPPHHSATAQ